MPLQPETKQFLSFLQRNRELRDALRAKQDQTLLYAGNFFAPMWREIIGEKRRNQAVAALETLPDVLARLPSSEPTHRHFLEHVEVLTKPPLPWQPDGIIVWRALSGILASNARGRVYFMVGSNVTPDQKVFASTEIHVLRRNPNIDAVTRDMVEYYYRCIQQKNSYMNLALIPM